MQATLTGDASLGIDAEHIAQPPLQSTPPVPSLSPTQMMTEICEAMAKLGFNLMIDEKETTFLEDDSMYKHKRLEEFIGFKICSDTLLTDLGRRRRLFLLYSHPDHHHDKPPSVLDWLTNMVQRVLQAFIDFEERLALVADQPKERPNSRTELRFQEFPEKLQIWLLHALQLFFFILNVSDSVYYAQGCWEDPIASPTMAWARYFFANIFQSPKIADHKNLYDVICEVAGIDSLPPGYRFFFGLTTSQPNSANGCCGIFTNFVLVLSTLNCLFTGCRLCRRPLQNLMNR